MIVPLVKDLIIILAAGFAAGLFCRRLGVSMVVGYLVVGTLIGEGALGWVRNEPGHIEPIARAGVLLLLFSIGLEFSLDELARIGRHLAVGGSVQMVLVTAPVTVFSILLGMPWKPALLIGFATALSSTVLVFKALAEWGQTSSPHGRRAIGILLFQDAALVPLLLMVPLLTGEGPVAGASAYAEMVAISVLLLVGVLVLRFVLRRWIVPLLAAVRSPELVVLFTLVVLGGVTLMVANAGLPAAVGAFAAGLVFSDNRLTGQVDALILPFRETFAAVFFVSLGLLLDPSIFWREAVLIVPGLVGVLVLKSAAGAVALRLTGLRWRAALGMGAGLAQLGEFSFVLVLQGTQAGVLSGEDYDRMLCFALATLILTPQLLKIALRWSPEEGALKRLGESPLAALPDAPHSAVVIGIGPVGQQVVSRLEIAGLDVCLVDLSPVNLHPFAQQGFRTVAGDATDREVLTRAQVPRAPLVVVAVPQDSVAVQIVRAVRSLNPTADVLVRCRYVSSTTDLKKAGANVVVSEELEASSTILRLLEESEKRKT